MTGPDSLDDQRASGQAMLGVSRVAKREGYTASYFVRMLSEIGPVETAGRLISAETRSEGFIRLYELRRLALTVEALALEPEWRDLFTEQERRCSRTLCRLRVGRTPLVQIPRLNSNMTRLDDVRSG